MCEQATGCMYGVGREVHLCTEDCVCPSTTSDRLASGSFAETCPLAQFDQVERARYGLQGHKYRSIGAGLQRQSYGRGVIA